MNLGRIKRISNGVITLEAPPPTPEVAPMKVTKAPRVGEVLPHIRRHPQRDALLQATDDALRALMAAGDMVAGLLLAMAPSQRVLLRARLKA